MAAPTTETHSMGTRYFHAASTVNISTFFERTLRGAAQLPSHPMRPPTESRRVTTLTNPASGATTDHRRRARARREFGSVADTSPIYF
jgi:hypothetical protein